MQEAGIASTCQQMVGGEVESSLLLRRIKGVLQQWLINPDMQSAEIILQEHVEHDDGTIQRAYSLVRLFVWTLPVLGLIGTVIGISLAVG